MKPKSEPTTSQLLLVVSEIMNHTDRTYVTCAAGVVKSIWTVRLPSVIDETPI